MTGAERSAHIAASAAHVEAIVKGEPVEHVTRPTGISPRSAFRGNRRGLQAWLRQCGEAVAADLSRFATDEPTNDLGGDRPDQ